MSETYDVAVIGGGVMGCVTALHLARGGMRVTVIERGGLCMEASGRNAGTLTLMFTRALLVPYTRRGRELWRAAPDWLGRDVGFKPKAGLEIAFSEEDAALMEEGNRKRVEAGADIEIIGANRAREIEPALSNVPVLATYSRTDAFAPSYTIGSHFRSALIEAGVVLREGTAVDGVDRLGAGWTVRTAAGAVAAKRVVLAGGFWIGRMARWFGLDLPIVARINQGTICERLPPLFGTVIRVFRKISLKQLANGTVLVGGGGRALWVKDPDHPESEVDAVGFAFNMVDALRAAHRAIPALVGGRVVRTWWGFEGFTPDNLPVVGPLPGIADAYAIGCLRSGFTAGPCMGKLLADALLGREPELPIFHPAFDPARLLTMKPLDVALPAQAA